MDANWKSKADWGRFYERIIETNGNISTTDAKDCGIPFDIWFELAMKNNPKGLVRAAKKYLNNAKEYTRKRRDNHA